MININKEYQHDRKMLLVVQPKILLLIHIFLLNIGSKFSSYKVRHRATPCDTMRHHATPNSNHKIRRSDFACYNFGTNLWGLLLQTERFYGNMLDPNHLFQDVVPKYSLFKAYRSVLYPNLTSLDQYCSRYTYWRRFPIYSSSSFSV